MKKFLLFSPSHSHDLENLKSELLQLGAQVVIHTDPQAIKSASGEFEGIALFSEFPQAQDQLKAALISFYRASRPIAVMGPARALALEALKEFRPTLGCSAEELSRLKEIAPKADLVILPASEFITDRDCKLISCLGSRGGADSQVGISGLAKEFFEMA